MDVEGATVIGPDRRRLGLDLRDLWTYRELFFFLVWRDVKIRYKQTVIGAAWAVIQPFFTMVVFSIFFGVLAKVPSDGVPYPVFSYCGLLPWTFFSNGMTQAANSLLGNATLISKVYFPRVLIPLSAIVTGLVDFGFALCVLVGMMLFYRIHPTWHIVWLPVFLVVSFIVALGAGLWLAALNVRFRDIRFVVGFVISFWLYATPVIYPSSLLGGRLASLVGLNPMSAVVEGFRWCLLGIGIGPGHMLLVSLGFSMFLLASGAWYFRRVERTFADVI
jgi:lipopolysaccharide transport system permease protein